MYQQQTQRKSQSVPSMTQNEVEARNKLASYVYEYLHHNGAQKAAEMFKSEVPGLPESSQLAPNGAPGFLYNWWTVFWDIYSATPDRREKGEATAEARAFADTFCGFGNPAVNGMQPFLYGQNAIGQGGIDPAMMNNFHRQQNPSTQSSPISAGYQPFPAHQMPRFPTRPAMPAGFPPNFEPRMIGTSGRMPPQRGAMSFSPNMRPLRPGLYGGPYLDSPATPTFQSNPMLTNGGQLNGPGPSMMNGPMDLNDPRFQMLGGMNPQFAMMNDPCAAGTPTSSSAGPTSIGGVGSVPPLGANIGGPSSVGSTHGNMNSIAGTDNSGINNNGPLSALLNGGDVNSELKHSPASVHGHINGGTPGQLGPGSHNNGPGSVTGLHAGPGSVQSQIGAPNSVNTANQAVQSNPQSYATQLTPNSQSEGGIIDYQQGGTNEGNDVSKDEEISKIKQSLIDGFHY